MGKRIIQQARGKGGPAYRVPAQAYRYRIKYPMKTGEAEIVELIHSAGHSAPLAKTRIQNETFYNPACDGVWVGQKIMIGSKDIVPGNIVMLQDIPIGTRIFNIELHPGDGGKMMRSAGSSAVVSKVLEHNRILVTMANKKEIQLSKECRATIGVVAGDGRTLKPFVTAGKKFFKMKTRNKLWPRTSAVKMNAIDHPFGSGRGKRIKPKIAKRNAPPGARVGHIRPRRTGRRK